MSRKLINIRAHSKRRCRNAPGKPIIHVIIRQKRRRPRRYAEVFPESPLEPIPADLRISSFPGVPRSPWQPLCAFESVHATTPKGQPPHTDPWTAVLGQREMQLSRRSGLSRHPARRITRSKTHNRPRPQTLPADDQPAGEARSRCGKLVNNLKTPARFLPVVLANLSKKRACRRFRPTQRDTDALPDASKPFQYNILEKSHSSVYHGDGIGIPVTCPAPPILPTFPADGERLVQNVDNSE